MNYAIIDDEPFWGEFTEQTLRKYIQLSPVQIDVCSSASEFFSKGIPYDVIITDIKMPEIDGFELAKTYKAQYPQCILIILTSYTELSRQGYHVDAFRFIDKMHLEELKEAISSIEKRFISDICVPVHLLYTGEVLLSASQLFYAETLKHNVLLHTVSGNFVCTDSMNALEKKFQNHGFFRCHRSYLINLNYIVCFGNHQVKMQNGDWAEVAIRKVHDLKFSYIQQLSI